LPIKELVINFSLDFIRQEILYINSICLHTYTRVVLLHWWHCHVFKHMYIPPTTGTCEFVA